MLKHQVYVLLLVLKCLPMSIFHCFGKYKRVSRQTTNNVRSSVRKWTWRVNTLFFSRNTRVLRIATLTDDERTYSWMDSNSFLTGCVSTKNKQAVNKNILSNNIDFYEYKYHRFTIFDNQKIIEWYKHGLLKIQDMVSLISGT